MLYLARIIVEQKAVLFKAAFSMAFWYYQLHKGQGQAHTGFLEIKLSLNMGLKDNCPDHNPQSKMASIDYVTK